MATISYYLRTSISSRLSPVYIRYVDGRKVILRTKTEFRVIPEVFGKGGKINEKLCNDVFTVTDARNLKNNMGDLRMKIMNAANLIGTEPTLAWLEEIIDAFHHPDSLKQIEVKEQETLNQYITRYLDEVEKGKRLTMDQKRFAATTLKAMKGFQSQFDEFQKEIKKVIGWQDIHQDFYNSYIAFFQSKNYRLNTIGRHVKHMKMILNAAINEGLTANIEHTRRSFKVVKTDVDFVYLTDKELKALNELEIELKGHALARDIFLVGCYTGQRFSDYSRIGKNHFRDAGNGRMVVDIRQTKTGKRVIIPARPELITIMERHDYKLPLLAEQKVNDYIKIVCRKVCKEGDNLIKVEVTETVGGMKVRKSEYKADMVKTHTARRTMLTNMYMAGIPLQDIMQISGHSSERQLRAYIKVDAEGTAQSLMNHPFFSQLKVV